MAGDRPDREPTEVTAARRHLGQPPRPPAPALPAPPIATSDAAVSMHDLIRHVLAASRLDIVGVLPWQLASHLIDQHEETASPASEVLPNIRYFTPGRDRIAGYKRSGVLGRVAQRWVAGITGLRNWVSLAHDDNEHLAIYEVDDLLLDCVIRTDGPRGSKAFLCVELPVVDDDGSSDRAKTGELLCAPLPQEALITLDATIERLSKSCRIHAPREVNCVRRDTATSPPDTDTPFRPVIERLTRYGANRSPKTILPIAAVAVCVETSRGPQILLKHRTPLNARNDFNTFALITERIVEQDFIEFLDRPLSSDLSDALDEIWKVLGRPPEMELPQRVFLKSAQRELFLTCGLDLDEARFRFCGTQLVTREADGIELGFYVFRVDLDRGQNDELNFAKEWNADLQLVPFGQLYTDAYLPRLNRLLRLRGAWIRSHVLDISKPGVEPKAAD